MSWRWATVLHGGDYRFSWGQVGYSDIVNLYILRDFAAHTFPYIHQPVEYPVLTGLTMWVTTYATGVQGYFLINGTLLAIAGFSALVVLSRFVTPGQLARYALAPGLFLYGALNWDMISLLALTAGIFAAERRRFGWCGIGIGLGASYKLYPAFLLPVLAARALRLDVERGDRPRETLTLLGMFLATTAIFNLPLAIISPSGWSYFLRFQSARPLDPDAIWSHLPAEPGTAITRAFVFVVVIGTLWMATRVYLNRGDGWQPAALACLLFFLVATRDYSPQYDVWPLPLLAILACPWELWGVFVAADVTYFVAIFLFLFPSFAWPPVLHNPDLALGVGVWAREVALLLLLVWALRRVLYSGHGESTRAGMPATFPLVAVALGTLSTAVGCAVGVAAASLSSREMVLVIEVLGVALGISLATYYYCRDRSNDVFLAAGAGLIPYLAAVVFNFAGIGSYLLPGLLVLTIGVVESRVIEPPGGEPPERRRPQTMPVAQDIST